MTVVLGKLHPDGWTHETTRITKQIWTESRGRRYKRTLFHVLHSQLVCQEPVRRCKRTVYAGPTWPTVLQWVNSLDLFESTAQGEFCIFVFLEETIVLFCIVLFDPRYNTVLCKYAKFALLFSTIHVSGRWYACNKHCLQQNAAFYTAN